MAGRIPEAFMQQLLARVDLAELIGERIELKRAGRDFQALCPFHHEKTPSFTVSPSKGFYHCFGCGKHGTAISFLMDYDRASFPEAVEQLARRVGLDVPHEEGGAPAPRPPPDAPLAALATAARCFRDELRKAAPAIAYLKRRGLSGDTAQRFGIGYAPPAWDFLARRFTDAAPALAAGLLKRSEGGRVYDVFRDRVMFPIRDLRGQVIGFGGRTLGDDPAKYLNTPETVLFHKGRNLFGLYEARAATPGMLPQLVVVEGYMDAVMLSQHGLTGTVATLGTATTRDHLHLLFKHSQKVVFCFDGDAAGRRAAWRALQQALTEIGPNRECRFVFLPDGQDPDTLVQAEGADAFARRIEHAAAAGEFALAELQARTDVATLDGRARLLQLATPLLVKVRDPALRAVLVGELARHARLPSAELQALVDNPAAAAPSPRRDAAGSRLLRGIMRALVEQPGLARGVDQPQHLLDAPVAGVGALVEALEFFAERPDANAAALAEFWRGTAKAEALLRLAPLPGVDSAAALESEFANGIRRLQLAAQRACARRLAAQIAARDQPSAELAALLAEIQRQLIQQQPSDEGAI
ncbi:MAG: DNA primase [Gammaproteobacteria bacterium]|nr:DNA primase [Gammaproteobacteria bacterium]